MYFLLVVFYHPFFNCFDKGCDLGSAAHDVGLSRPAAPLQNRFQKRLGHPGLTAEDVGDQASRLAGIEGNPDKKLGEAGGNARHLPGDCIFDDRPQKRAVLQVDILLEGFGEKRSSGCGEAHALLTCDALEFRFDKRRNPDLNRLGSRRVSGCFL
jgi:hypothetical protein